MSWTASVMGWLRYRAKACTSNLSPLIWRALMASSWRTSSVTLVFSLWYKVQIKQIQQVSLYNFYTELYNITEFQVNFKFSLKMSDPQSCRRLFTQVHFISIRVFYLGETFTSIHYKAYIILFLLYFHKIHFCFFPLKEHLWAILGSRLNNRNKTGDYP